MPPTPSSILRKAYRKVRPAPPSRKLDKLFFVHIPKCGGMSIDGALQRAYADAGAQVVRLDAVAAKRAAEAIGESMGTYRRWLLPYYMAGKKEYISGHFPFSETVHEAFGEGWHYATVLREPVARWISNYFYNKYKTHSDYFRIEEPLDEFIETKKAQHYGSNYVASLTDLANKNDVSEEVAVEQAIRNLDLFSVVGVLERLDEFAAACEKRFGVRLDIEHRNKNPRSGNQQREEIGDETRERIRELCAPNLRIYEAALALVDGHGARPGTGSTAG